MSNFHNDITNNIHSFHSNLTASIHAKHQANMNRNMAGGTRGNNSASAVAVAGGGVGNMSSSMTSTTEFGIKN